MHTRSNQAALPRGWWGQLRMVLLQPDNFFKALGRTHSAWLMVAVGLMLLTGISEVQRQTRMANQAEVAPAEASAPPMDMGMSAPPMGGGVPLPPTDTGSPAAPAAPFNEQLEQVLGASGGILGLWLLITPLLWLVTLFNGYAPQWSRSLQIAVWATVPLGVLAVLQLAYYSAGGKAGELGLVGIVDELPFFAALTISQQSLLLSAASKMTLFHGWTLALMVLGARQTLQGKRVIVGFVMLVWLLLVITLPVLGGAFAVAAPLPVVNTLPETPVTGDLPLVTTDIQREGNPQ